MSASIHFVTGATGLVGSHIAEQLVARSPFPFFFLAPPRLLPYSGATSRSHIPGNSG